MKKILLLIAVTTALMFSACSESKEPTEHEKRMEMQRLQGNQQIQMERAANQQHNEYQRSNSGYDGSDVLTGVVAGAVVGNMLSGGSNNGGSTTVNKTYVNKTYNAPTPQSSTQSTKYTSVKPKPSKATYTPKKAPVPEKAKYRSSSASSYKSTQKKASYRPSSSSSYKSSSRKSSYRKKR